MEAAAAQGNGSGQWFKNGTANGNGDTLLETLLAQKPDTTIAIPTGLNFHQMNKERQRARNQVTMAERKVETLETRLREIETALSTPSAHQQRSGPVAGAWRRPVGPDRSHERVGAGRVVCGSAGCGMRRGQDSGVRGQGVQARRSNDQQATQREKGREKKEEETLARLPSEQQTTDNTQQTTQTEAVIVSCDPEFAAIALREWKELLPAQRPCRNQRGWTMARRCAKLDCRLTTLPALVARHAPIFIRHIAPVQRVVALDGTENDVDRLAGAASELAYLLNPYETFAAQSRFLSEMPRPYRKFALNEALSARLTAQTGAQMECKTPAYVVSVLCSPDAGYIGISRATQNLSAWPGGEHRFKRDEAQISRAEFKLLEAIDVFGLEMPSGGKALDMGAAPGGWTRVLRQFNIRVVAVDPADMDARFRRDPNVTHVAQIIEAFLPTVKTRFDLIVNDMRMEADESVERMLAVSRHLLPGHLAVMTLKLTRGTESRRDILGEVRQALSRLGRDYDIIGARQLFHNRSEVTVAMRTRTVQKQPANMLG